MPIHQIIPKYLLLSTFLFLNACSGQSQLVSETLQTITEEELQYYLYYPEAYEASSETGFGLLLFLHGGGESGGNLEDIKRSGPPKLFVEGKQFPFLVLAPRNPHTKKWWNTRAVMQLLDTIIETNNVDKNRVYLSGLSRGGSAAWEMATQYPDRFAALAVICGMAPLPYAHWIDREMPIWVFHGVEDNVIDVQESDVMVKKLEEMGYDVRYSRYNGVGHNAWERAYTTDSLYSWMAQQRRKD